MNIDIINPTVHPNWDSLILSHSNYSFFHSSAWARVLSEAYGYKPLYFTIFDGDAISACLPVMEVNSFITGKRGVSLPFTDYCEPLIRDPARFEALLNYVKEYGNRSGWKYLELRGGKGLLPEAQASVSYLGHALDLTVGTDKLFSEFRKGTKSSIKKAEREKVKVEVSSSLESVKEFYRLNAITRKHHGLPPQPFSFFEKLHRYVISTGSGFVVLASYFDAVIAGAVFVHAGTKAMYKYGASKREYQELRANNLVMWEALKHYGEGGYETLCFGRTDPDNKGLQVFKHGWGTEERTINYYRHDLRQNRFVTERSQVNGFSTMVFGKLPIPVLNAIGSLAYRHMG
jgi:hypothetical protein